MEKEKNFECYSCGTYYVKWVGRCTQCNEWNTLKEIEKISVLSLDSTPAEIRKLDEVEGDSLQIRYSSQVAEFDRVLGGGLVVGSVGIIGGEPGIGKSTLILQLVAKFNSLNVKTIYVTGEESVFQIKDRAERLGLDLANILIMTETSIEKIFQALKSASPQLVIIDSIHTMKAESVPSSAGSVNQIREISGLLVSYAKQHNISFVLIGHVTKEGYLAGPKTLEHIVDYAIYLDGEKSNTLRILRAVKNRFGSLQEIGLFKMTGKGLAEVKNNNKVFMELWNESVHGTAIYPSQEGSRLLLVEVQALVSEKNSDYYARTAIGVDRNKLLMLIAILEKYLGVNFIGRDLYLNIAGGYKTNDPAIDMAAIAAILSSYWKIKLSSQTIFWGEVTLTGEFRSPLSWEDKIQEIERCGCKRIVLPTKAIRKKTESEIDILTVKNVNDLSAIIKEN